MKKELVVTKEQMYLIEVVIKECFVNSFIMFSADDYLDDSKKYEAYVNTMIDIDNLLFSILESKLSKEQFEVFQYAQELIETDGSVDYSECYTLDEFKKFIDFKIID